MSARPAVVSMSVMKPFHQRTVSVNSSASAVGIAVLEKSTGGLLGGIIREQKKASDCGTVSSVNFIITLSNMGPAPAQDAAVVLTIAR